MTTDINKYKSKKLAAMHEKHPSLYGLIEREISKVDPADLFNKSNVIWQDPHFQDSRTPEDEYKPEVEDIFLRVHECHNADDVRELIYVVFAYRFGIHHIHPKIRYEEAASHIWVRYKYVFL